MTLEEVKTDYPMLGARLPEDIFTARELVVVDYNYDDVDAEEAGEFDPSEYNHMAYIAEAASEILGAEGLVSLAAKIEAHPDIDDFFASEEDLFGIQSRLDEEKISRVIFGMIEEMMA